jgi:ribosomal protein S12 methylthiotransferase accessory factor
VSYRTESTPQQIMLGFGAHLEPRIAVLRAATELTQMLNPFLVGDRKPAHSADHDHEVTGESAPLPADDGDPLVQQWLQTGTLADHPYLAPDPSLPPRAAADYPRQWSDDLRDDVLACQALVEQLGMELLVLDQTRADIGLPVVKVVVPGLRHFWPRHGPGRLYEAPARLGWLPAPLTEDGINPVAMVL